MSINSTVSTDVPKWGDPRRCQVNAEYEGIYPKMVRIPIIGTHIKVNSLRMVNTRDGYIVPDSACALRKFKHRCGLVMMTTGISIEDTSVTLHLDGWSNCSLPLRMTEVKFDPRLENGPLADVWYKGHCTRWGPMNYGCFVCAADLIFRDRDQFNQYSKTVVVPPSPKCNVVVSQSSEYPGGFDMP